MEIVYLSFGVVYGIRSLHNSVRDGNKDDAMLVVLMLGVAWVFVCAVAWPYFLWMESIIKEDEEKIRKDNAELRK